MTKNGSIQPSGSFDSPYCGTPRFVFPEVGAGSCSFTPARKHDGHQGRRASKLTRDQEVQSSPASSQLRIPPPACSHGKRRGMAQVEE
jgi:hypothetical protein